MYILFGDVSIMSSFLKTLDNWRSKDGEPGVLLIVSYGSVGTVIVEGVVY